MKKEYNLDYLAKTNWSLVLIKNGKVLYKSKLPRLRPLILCIKKHGKTMRGGTVYDKKIGRAAAILLTHARVKEIWTPTISREGKKYLTKHKVRFAYKGLVKSVRNQEGNGPCPMEKMSKEMTEKEFINKMLG